MTDAPLTSLFARTTYAEHTESEHSVECAHNIAFCIEEQSEQPGGLLWESCQKERYTFLLTRMDELISFSPHGPHRNTSPPSSMDDGPASGAAQSFRHFSCKPLNQANIVAHYIEYQTPRRVPILRGANRTIEEDRVTTLGLVRVLAYVTSRLMNAVTRRSARRQEQVGTHVMLPYLETVAEASLNDLRGTRLRVFRARLTQPSFPTLPSHQTI